MEIVSSLLLATGLNIAILLRDTGVIANFYILKTPLS
jgi:hypothetical protein